MGGLVDGRIDDERLPRFFLPEKFKTLLPIGASIDGAKLSFPNDVDVDPKQQVVYLSDSDTKWGWDDYMLSLLEFDNNSRWVGGQAPRIVSGHLCGWCKFTRMPELGAIHLKTNNRHIRTRSTSTVITYTRISFVFKCRADRGVIFNMSGFLF